MHSLSLPLAAAPAQLPDRHVCSEPDTHGLPGCTAAAAAAAADDACSAGTAAAAESWRSGAAALCPTSRRASSRCSVDCAVATSCMLVPPRSQPAGPTPLAAQLQAQQHSKFA